MTSVTADPRDVILAPVVSEKSYGMMSSQNTFTFRVHPQAHKTQIKQAVETLFNVHVVEVRTIKVRPKPKRRGMFRGTRAGYKKAIVQLRAGDSIELFEGVA
jgi:large subunit ribosomal protein L23